MTDRSYEPLNPEVARISDGFAVRQGEELIALCCSEDLARAVVVLPELLEALQEWIDVFMVTGAVIPTRLIPLLRKTSNAIKRAKGETT